MLILLSPAKTLDFDPSPLDAHSEPQLYDDTGKLVRKMRNLSAKKLESLMGISRDLALLNQQRYREIPDDAPAAPDDGGKQALLAFKGDTYRDMNLEAWDDDDWQEAQRRLRILSGLYGVLRPLDLIHPYRLEMGTRLKTRRGTSLYDFWGDRIARQLNETLDELGTTTTVNLASVEYFKSTDRPAFRGDVVQPVFKDYKNGAYKVMSFFAKRARGAMASWIVSQRIDDVESLEAFEGLGYHYDGDTSTERELVFLRRNEP